MTRKAIPFTYPSVAIGRARPGHRSKKVTVPKCRVCKKIDSFYKKNGYFDSLICDGCGADELEMVKTRIKWEDY